VTYDDVPRAFRIALGVHEAYRRMGFPAESLYAHRNDDGEFMYVLKEQGRTFAFTCGPIELNEEGCEAAWAKTVTFFTSDSKKATRLWGQLWREFEGQMDMALFLAKILEKGFVVPILPAWTRPS
jgi:hypothetical protein